MPSDNVLTAEARATIMDACASILRSADALKDCHTIDGDWGDDGDAKAFYDAELRLLKRLTALLAHTGQPVADDAAVRGDERAKRKAFTAVFLDVTTDKASEIVNHPKWSAGSWSHALDDRDAARAELARATSSQAHPGQPEPRAEVKPVKIERHSDMSVLVVFSSCRQASVFEKEIAARAQGGEKS